MPAQNNHNVVIFLPYFLTFFSVFFLTEKSAAIIAQLVGQRKDIVIMEFSEVMVMQDFSVPDLCPSQFTAPLYRNSLRNSHVFFSLTCLFFCFSACQKAHTVAITYDIPNKFVMVGTAWFL